MLDALDDIYSLSLFSDAERALRDAAREKIAAIPRAQVEGNGEAALIASTRALGARGLLSCTQASESGDINLSELCLVRELCAQHSPMLDLALVMQALGSLPITLAGSDEQKARWLPSYASGESIGAFAITEPEAGSDVASLTLSAERKGESYILNGTKHLISNAGVATGYCLFARTAPGPKGVTCFYLPGDARGLSVTQTPPTSPHPLGVLELRDVEVSLANRLGAEGDGLKIALKTLARCRPTVGAGASGMARRALELAIERVTQREQFGAKLAEQQLVASMISHSVTELDAARLLVYRAAKLFDANPSGRHDRAAGEAKWFATESAQKIIDRSLQLFGGQGVLQSSEIADLYNAIRPLRIYEGASEIQQVVIARDLLKG